MQLGGWIGWLTLGAHLAQAGEQEGGDTRAAHTRDAGTTNPGSGNGLPREIVAGSTTVKDRGWHDGGAIQYPAVCFWARRPRQFSST